jgi:hypothetical protein
MEENIITTTQSPLDSKEGGNQALVFQTQDGQTRLEVELEEDTVWLNQEQMSQLFGKGRTTITEHIRNIFAEGELIEKEVCRKFRRTTPHGAMDGFLQTKEVKFYNLDVIISVGYRVKSIRGTQFRQWANKVLKDYLLRGYAVNHKINQLEDKIDRRFADYDRKIENLNEQVDFFVRTSLPPIEKVFFDGQLFDAYMLMSWLIGTAERRVVLIDNYVDESVLALFSKRKENTSAIIYTMQISNVFKIDLNKYNQQFPSVIVKQYTKAHDRFLIIDDKVYHVGASVKDLGKKLCAVSLLSCINADEMLSRIE